MELVFSYGTLREAAVQLATYGRRLTGSPDVLVGYRLGSIQINSAGVVELSGAATHPIVFESGDPSDRVEGVLFELTAEELAATDEYETNQYVRAPVVLQSGRSAWVYKAPSN